MIDSISCKENFSSIVGFQSHWHLARNLQLGRNNYKKHEEKKSSTTNTYTSKLQELGDLNNWERQCFVMPLTIYLGKLPLDKIV
jgi:hypothetical protein